MDNKEIEDLARKEVTKKLDLVPDGDKGTYFHGWFDCLYFISEVKKK